MIRIIVFVVLALWSSSGWAQFNTPYVLYSSQLRGVSARATADVFDPIAPVTNESTLTAPDFQPFSQNLVESSSSPSLTEPSSATAVAMQNSQFGVSLSASGSVSARATGASLPATATALAQSYIQTTFTLSEPAILSMQLAAHVDGSAASTFNSATVTFTLSPGLTLHGGSPPNFVLATNILPDQHDSIVTYPPSQILLSGVQYTINVTATAFDSGPDTSTSGAGPFASASYSFVVNPVPEPNGMILQLMGAVAIALRRWILK